MDIPNKKLNNGFQMPAYGLGTWQMGGTKSRDLSNDDDGDRRAIEVAIERGVTHIDTAESYADGHAEVLVGRAIERFDRDRVFLASKFSARHAAMDDVVASAEASLRRLGTEYLDLYLLHSFSSVVPLEETMLAMGSLIDRGLVRNIGVSNFGSDNLAKAQAASGHPIVVNQVHYNLQVREPEHEGVLRYCQENDVLLCAWRPLDFDATSLDSISPLAKERGCTTRQLGLNWLMSQQNVTTVCRTKNVSHLEENLGALGWQLDPRDVEDLRSGFPDQLTVSPVVRLDH